MLSCYSDASLADAYRNEHAYCTADWRGHTGDVWMDVSEHRNRCGSLGPHSGSVAWEGECSAKLKMNREARLHSHRRGSRTGTEMGVRDIGKYLPRYVDY